MTGGMPHPLTHTCTQNVNTPHVRKITAAIYDSRKYGHINEVVFYRGAGLGKLNKSSLNYLLYFCCS